MTPKKTAQPKIVPRKEWEAARQNLLGKALEEIVAADYRSAQATVATWLADERFRSAVGKGTVPR